MGRYDIRTMAILYDSDGKEVARDARNYGGPVMLFAMVRDTLLEIASISSPCDAYAYTIRWKFGNFLEWDDVERVAPQSLDPTKSFKPGDKVAARIWTYNFVGTVESINGFLVTCRDDAGKLDVIDCTVLKKSE